MLLKETLKEMNRLKSNCSANRSIYALLMVHCLLLLLCYGHACAPNPCSKSRHATTEMSVANMRYPRSLTPSPTVARRRRLSCLRYLTRSQASFVKPGCSKLMSDVAVMFLGSLSGGTMLLCHYITSGYRLVIFLPLPLPLRYFQQRDVDFTLALLVLR